ncbi:hypothetical protein IKF33_03325 [Candidatus Saccharibacteria bacterium]|nr:hypothetical protein [Candidatus Saccharibacteria bacterium]
MLKTSHQLTIFTFVISLFFFTFFVSIAPVSALSPIFTTGIKAHSQGATITKNYFIYTIHPSDNDITLYRCSRSGDKISNDCKKINGKKNGDKKLGHGNVLDHEWGSNYFWVFDSGSAKRKKHRWCFDLSGNQVSQSNCYKVTTENPRSPGGISQGFAIYGKYRLKAQSAPNKIYVYKKSSGKKVKELSLNVAGETEDVMVDGDTGAIYFTVSSYNSISLYKYPYSKYHLEPIGSQSDSSTSRKVHRKRETNADKYPISSLAKRNEGNTDINTTFFGTLQADKEGCGVYMVLNIILTVLTFGVGIAATVGMVISAITYMSATSNPEQIIKAKKRIAGIIIGLALYACLWSLLNFLIPGGVFSGPSGCSF